METKDITRDEDPTNRDAAIKDFCEFQWKALSEAASTLIRGMTFYLVIFAALMGYLLTKELPDELKNAIMVVGVIVSFFAALACGSIGWGYQHGLRGLEKIYRLLNKDVFNELDASGFFKRGRRVVWVVLFSAAMILVTFTISLALLLRTNGS